MSLASYVITNLSKIETIDCRLKLPKCFLKQNCPHLSLMPRGRYWYFPSLFTGHGFISNFNRPSLEGLETRRGSGSFKITWHHVYCLALTTSLFSLKAWMVQTATGRQEQEAFLFLLPCLSYLPSLFLPFLYPLCLFSSFSPPLLPLLPFLFFSNLYFNYPQLCVFICTCECRYHQRHQSPLRIQVIRNMDARIWI